MEPISIKTAIHLLDNISRRFKDAERKLSQQRVNCAILTLELATLHDPHMRETLAVCHQAQDYGTEKLSTYNEIHARFIQVSKSCIPQEELQNIPQETQGSALQEPQLLMTSNCPVNQNPKPQESQDPQPSSDHDLQRVMVEIKQQDENIPDEPSKLVNSEIVDPADIDPHNHHCNNSNRGNVTPGQLPQDEFPANYAVNSVSCYFDGLSEEGIQPPNSSPLGDLREEV
ncbi:uncharacterized protein LOC121859103 [Homarus americanus]|uniref:Uncharacterized protein n=1 Tax=Homarus americanus TaxID=6706 RepID=A0A8J5N7E8_HOMAM|nr:uncharacterized protein LOC121859103 [Homarus americanus]KAG7174607.1 hypothetical protein Hamer_G015732 [Homarus americanus]